MNISKPSQTSNPEKNQKENVNPSILPSSVAQFNDNSSGLEPQGIFVYGTLMAAEFLSWLLTGSSENYKAIISLRQSATLMHYRRVAVNHGDYPALIPGDMSDKVDGFLIVPTSKSQWKKIDDFEGESYRRHCVHVHLQEEDRTVPAHVYIWQGNMDMLLPYKEWSSSYFREERLQDWLGLFDGMEMLGEELELVAALQSDIAINEAKALEMIAFTIRSLGFRSAVFILRSTRDEPDYSVWNVCLDVTILEDTSTMPILDSTEPPIEHFGVEIVSPIFFNDRICDEQLSHLLGPTGIRLMIPLYTKCSTGLHIHVGLSSGDRIDFSLEEVKAVAYAVLFFEEVVDRLHHPSRSVTIPNDDPMSNRSNPRLRNLDDSTVRDLLSQAQTTKDVVSLVCCDEDREDYTGYGGAKIYKVNFSSIVKCGTIEFRQHISTTNANTIIRWTQFVLLFVERSLTQSPSVWASLSLEKKNLEFLFSEFLGKPDWISEFDVDGEGNPGS